MVVRAGSGRAHGFVLGSDRARWQRGADARSGQWEGPHLWISAAEAVFIDSREDNCAARKTSV